MVKGKHIQGPDIKGKDEFDSHALIGGNYYARQH